MGRSQPPWPTGPTVSTKDGQLKVLSHLLDEVDRFNEMIKAVEILEELRQADQSSKRLALDNPEAVTEALHLTRESLVCGLMSDKIMRKHERFIARRHELFTSIETNLSSLQTLQATEMAGGLRSSSQ